MIDDTLRCCYCLIYSFDCTHFKSVHNQIRLRRNFLLLAGRDDRKIFREILRLKYYLLRSSIGTSAFDQIMSTWYPKQFCPRGALIRFCCCLMSGGHSAKVSQSVTVALNETKMMRINKQAGHDCVCNVTLRCVLR